MTPSARIYAKAVELLSRREHSRAELQQKLHRKFQASGENCLNADIEEICNRLSAQGYQSDLRFAQSYVRARVAKGFGPVRIRAELVDKGIDLAVAENVLAQFKGQECDGQALGDHDSGQEDEFQDRLFQVWRKKFAVRPVNLTEKSRQQRYFLYRGFSLEQVERLYVALADLGV